MSRPAHVLQPGPPDAAAALTRAWVGLYTLGLPAEVRDGRRSEIESDLHEHCAEAAAAGASPVALAAAVLARAALGVPADVLWRAERARPGRLEAGPGVLGRRRRSLPLLAAVLGAASALLATSLFLPLVAGHPTPSPNALLGAGGPVGASNSPAVAINPRDPRSVVIASRLDRPGFGATLSWTADRGRSWSASKMPLPDGAGACPAPAEAGGVCPYEPDAGFGPDGTLHVAYVSLAGPGNRPEALWLSRSTDGGRTLAPPVEVARGLVHQPRVAAGRDGAVHVTWMQADEEGLLRVIGGSAVMAATSGDGGQRFGAPVRVSDPGRPRVGGAVPLVDAAGRLLVLYTDFRDDVRDFENLEGPAWERPFALVLSRSSNGGRSFGAGTEVDGGLHPGRRFVAFSPPFPSIAAGAGILYVAWSDARTGDEDVFLRRSGDGGRTWSPALRVNGNREGDATSQSQPEVAVGPGGRVDVLYLDRRRDPAGAMTEAWLATSHDRGATFSHRRVSPAPFDSRLAPRPGPHLAADAGSRLGLASLEGGVVAAWADTRRGTAASGLQEVAAVGIHVEGPPGLPPRLPLALGLAAAAGIALAAGGGLGPRDRRPGPGLGAAVDVVA